MEDKPAIDKPDNTHKWGMVFIMVIVIICFACIFMSFFLSQDVTTNPLFAASVDKSWSIIISVASMLVGYVFGKSAA